jgi:alanine racemase
MPAVKADAYGHGAVECARALESAGADWFGVALVEEGAQLRDAGITRPILCLSGCWDGQEGPAVANDLTPVVFRPDQIERLARVPGSGRRVSYHLKIDTGMGRLGVLRSDLEGLLKTAKRHPNLHLDGVMTHLSSAEIPDKQEFTAAQLDRFDEALALITEHGFKLRWIHAANGAAVHSIPRARGGQFNLVRPGGVVYGLWRDVTNPGVAAPDWKPVLSLRTGIGHLKEVPEGTPVGYGGTFVTRRPTRIATLPIGYADGLSRALSNRGQVLVRGTRAPIVGRISMDLTLIDVTDVQNVGLGDEVMIVGCQGGEEITAEEVATSVNSISYEVTCSVSRRVPRVYIAS